MSQSTTRDFGLAGAWERIIPSDLDARGMMAIARRQARLVLACTFAGGLLGGVYILTAQRQYVASASIMIDKRQPNMVRDNVNIPEAPNLMSEEVTSQVEVALSDQVGLSVVQQLKLATNPQFVPPSRWQSIKEMFGWPGPAVNGLEQELTALRYLKRDLRVYQVPRTYVLKLEYTAPSPTEAAEIANVYANAYTLAQYNARVEATRNSRRWLEQRTEELRGLASQADLALQQFRAEHNLLAPKGTLVSEQQLSEMTTQLVTQRAATAQAQARYLQIKEVIDKHETDAAVTESINNPVINDLRLKYLDASRRMVEFQRKLGPTHRAVINLKNSLNELTGLLFKELGRIAETYRNEYEVAAAREKSLAEAIERDRTRAASSNDSLVKLHQLEVAAESYKNLYQIYVQSYQESVRLENSPATNAYVFSKAYPPLAPSSPRKLLVLTFCLLMGGVVGLIIAAKREYQNIARVAAS